MRLWFAPHSDVPLYRQLVTQVTLAILSGDLQPGDRLPSTRELARRFAIHPNTISAGYRQLEHSGLTETRHGSGVFVRHHATPPTTPEQLLDLHLATFFRTIRDLNLPAATVRAHLAHWLAAPPPDHFLLIDPDPELRSILLAEIRPVTTLAIHETSLEDLANPATLTAAIPLCRPSKTTVVRAALPAGVELITLPITSTIASLAPWMNILQQPAAETHLLAVLSHWPDFLTLARTMLTAAGIPADALLICDATQPHWQRGLDQASVVLTDAYTATLPDLPPRPTRILFPLLAETTRDLLSLYAQHNKKKRRGDIVSAPLKS